MKAEEDIFEVEKKYKVSSLRPYISLLQKANTKETGKKRQHDKVFLPSGVKTFRDFTPNMPIARIRSEAKNSMLTLKIGGDENSTQEIETEVGNASAIGKIIEILGMKETLEIIKTRRTFIYNKLTITCDNVVGLGYFIEIEKIVANRSDIPTALQEIDSVAKNILGLNNDMIEKERYDILIDQRQLSE